ncbi:hypothetical protein HKCCE3408_16495 [Rhodobacterales bacterium HKCCE3408]|nr:hypothetical protein [Rhodobacterales bacterium HKCCE3408]
MAQDFEYRSRPGNLYLSLAALAGIALLAAVIWTVAPVFALILLVPAILVSFYQIVVSPIYGMRVTGDAWEVYAGDTDRSVKLDEIGHVQVSDKASAPRATLVLTDGQRIDLPDEALPEDPMALVREATARGLRIRQV